MASLRPVIPQPAEQLEVVERLTKSDEVFVLLEGRVILVIARRGATRARFRC